MSHRMRPVICNYYLTYRCNARCSFCTIWRDGGVPQSEEAPAETVRTNLAALRQSGVRIVDFTGGEPLLYRELSVILAAARDLGLRTTVTSNGILYPDRASELAGLIDILQFSLDGADRAAHDAVTGVPSFDRVVESVEAARRLGERPTFIHTVTDENIGSLDAVMELARSMRTPLFLNPAFSYPGTRGLSREGARELGEKARGRGVTIDRGFLDFLLDGGNSRGNPRCLAVSSTVVISPDDRLVLPCFHFRKRNLPIGGDLARLLASPEVAEERNMAGRHPFCEGCGVYCYMRASLFRRLDRYCFLSLLSAGKYLIEYYRAPKQ